MTAQHQHDHQDHHDATQSDEPTGTGPSDPLGPITMPKRTKVGARAMALVGTVGLSAVAAAAISSEMCSTWTMVSVN